MQFSAPLTFEIPEGWWREAEIQDFRPFADAYVASTVPEWPTELVLLSDIKPPTRNPGVRWFERERMVKILQGIKLGVAIPPVPVHEPPAMIGYRYEVRDGFHRFYAAVALGFQRLPVVILPYFDIARG